LLMRTANMKTAKYISTRRSGREHVVSAKKQEILT
jgi:hypothetical protein